MKIGLKITEKQKSRRKKNTILGLKKQNSILVCQKTDEKHEKTQKILKKLGKNLKLPLVKKLNFTKDLLRLP